MFSPFGQNKPPAIPLKIIREDAAHHLSTHTPHIPPNIDNMKINERTIDRDLVGNIYEAIKFAEEEAGEANMNIKT